MAESKNLIFLKKHGINILIFLILCGLYCMGFAIPYSFFWLLYAIIPLSAYIMHRYHIVTGLIAPLVFGLLSFFLNQSNLYLFFIAPALTGQFGLYYALKSGNYSKGILISALSVMLGIIISIFGICIISGTLNFPSLMKKEVLKSHNDIVITSQAKSYFDSLYPTDEDKEYYGLPSDVTVPEGVDPEVYSHLYVYGNLIERSMNEDIIFYIFSYVALLGGSIYLIGNLFIRKLLIQSYFYRPSYPVIKEIKTDETKLCNMRLPKNYLLITGIPVIFLLLIGLASEYVSAIANAAGYALIVAPFALSGICFCLKLADIASNGWRIFITSVIIIVILLSILFDGIVIMFAVFGIADYLLNIRRLIDKIFKSEDI